MVSRWRTLLFVQGLERLFGPYRATRGPGIVFQGDGRTRQVRIAFALG